MAMESLAISLSEGSTQLASEVRVDGVVDTATASQLEEVFESLLKRGRYRIVVDLAGVDYISSAGWGIFIANIRDVRANDGDIKLANMIPNVYEIYDLLEFNNVLRAYNSVDDARRDFGETVIADPKKKSPTLTRVTLEDHFSNLEQPGFSSIPSEDNYDHNTGLDSELLRLVKDDPFASIREMVHDLRRRSEFSSVGWWKVFRILKSHRLLTKRKRFRFMRGR